MILESLALLIVALGYKVSTDIATNIENRIINAAIDVVNQNQQPSLATLGLYMSDLQKKQEEIRADQRRQIEMYYKDGISFLGYADRATDKNQKERFIWRAIECFTSASNIEVGEAAAKATLFVGACFYALRCIDHKTDIALENHEYDRAFHIAEQSLRSEAFYRPFRSHIQALEPFRKPPSELIEQLLRLPYLQEKYGTFEVYWKKWEPEPPKFTARLKQPSRNLSWPPKVTEPPKFTARLKQPPRNLSWPPKVTEPPKLIVEPARYWVQYPGEQKVWGETSGYTKTQMLEFIAQRVVLTNTLVNVNSTGWLPANQVVVFQQALIAANGK